MRRATILFIACCYLIFFVLIPPFQLNDEPDHFQFIYYLSKGIYPQVPEGSGYYAFDPTIKSVYDVVEVASNDYHIPNFQKINNAVVNNVPFTTDLTKKPITYQAHHPPFYFFSALLFFLPGSIVSKGGLIPTYYVTRLTSTFFYILAVFFAWRIALFLIKKKNVAEVLTVVFAINPVTLKMGVAINPDIASTALCLGTFLFFLFLNAQKRIRSLMLVSAILIPVMATYVKFQNIVLILFSLIFFIFRGYKEHKVKQYVFIGIKLFLISVLLLIPWFLYSFLRYQSITPSQKAFTFFCTSNLAPIQWYLIPFETVAELRHAFFHFAGFLGWGEPYPFFPFFYCYTIIFITTLSLGVIYVIRHKEEKWALLLVFAFCITSFFLGVSFTYKLNRYSCDIQGRYLLGVLFPFILFVYRGIGVLCKKHQESISKSLLFFAVWQYLFVLCYVLIPRYYV